MTGEDLIRQVQEEYSEYLEMVQCPATFVAGVLAGRMVTMMDHMEFIERRLDAVERRIKYDSRI